MKKELEKEQRKAFYRNLSAGETGIEKALVEMSASNKAAEIAG